jgi:hypothetical protein
LGVPATKETKGRDRKSSLRVLPHPLDEDVTIGCECKLASLDVQSIPKPSADKKSEITHLDEPLVSSPVNQLQLIDSSTVDFDVFVFLLVFVTDETAQVETP